MGRFEPLRGDTVRHSVRMVRRSCTDVEPAAPSLQCGCDGSGATCCTKDAAFCGECGVGESCGERWAVPFGSGELGPASLAAPAVLRMRGDTKAAARGVARVEIEVTAAPLICATEQAGVWLDIHTLQTKGGRGRPFRSAPDRRRPLFPIDPSRWVLICTNGWAKRVSLGSHPSKQSESADYRRGRRLPAAADRAQHGNARRSLQRTCPMLRDRLFSTEGRGTSRSMPR